VEWREREDGAATTTRASTADTRKWLAVHSLSLIQRPWVDRLHTAELQATEKRRFHPLPVRSKRLQQATQVAARGQRRQVASVHPGCVQLDVSVASKCRQSKPMDALEERHLERVPQGVAHARRVDRRLLQACAFARVSSASRLESTPECRRTVELRVGLLHRQRRQEVVNRLLVLLRVCSRGVSIGSQTSKGDKRRTPVFMLATARLKRART